ncbi:MAG TPA: type II CAAX endopeptidase family protein [Patescibacteria group bacterium]
MNKKISAFKNATILFVFLLLVWGLYRYIFQLPDTIEEIIVKPIIWIGATFYLVRKEKQKLESIGLTSKNLFPAIYFAIGLGLIFAVEGILVNFLKYGHLNFQANIGSQAMFISLGISIATAISEEIAFRGYIFTRLWAALKNEWIANLITSILWTAIHVPVTIFVLKYSVNEAVVYLFLTFIYGLGAAFIYARTKNVASSIFLHVLWEWPINLFR